MDCPHQCGMIGGPWDPFWNPNCPVHGSFYVAEKEAEQAELKQLRTEVERLKEEIDQAAARSDMADTHKLGLMIAERLICWWDTLTDAEIRISSEPAHELANIVQNAEALVALEKRRLARKSPVEDASE
jgi:hypothetical protein